MLALIIDDEPDIAELLEIGLGTAGFETVAVSDGETGLKLAAERRPDVVLLDWMLPGMAGPEICRHLKQDPATRHARVVFVTARATDPDRLQAFGAGADDYVTKPFYVRELVLRCQALVRTAPRHKPPPLLSVGPLRIDDSVGRAYVDGEEVGLTRIQFKLLKHFMSAPDRVHSRGDLLRAVWQRGTFPTRTVDVHVARLRERLGRRQEWLQTVRGVGYRLGPPSTRQNR